ncbi:hypothetical protein D3C84_1104090 [compost metagenome]
MQLRRRPPVNQPSAKTDWQTSSVHPSTHGTGPARGGYSLPQKRRADRYAGGFVHGGTERLCRKGWRLCCSATLPDTLRSTRDRHGPDAAVERSAGTFLRWVLLSR